MTITVADNGGASNPTLPPVVLSNWKKKTSPVVQVCDANGRTVSMAWMTGKSFAPVVFEPDGLYTIKVICPEAKDEQCRLIKTFENIRVNQQGELQVKI